MKRSIIIILLLFTTTITFAGSFYRDSCYSIGLSASYEYNLTYEHHGAITLDANLPINPHFEGGINIRALTANVYDFNARLRPKFILPVGELFFNLQLLYNLNMRSSLHSITGALSFGYRMDYIHFHFGCGLRILDFLHTSSHTTENNVYEPYNFTYYVEVFARPHTSMWNISACITNLTDYQMERMYEPTFIVNSYVHLNPNWTIKMQANCKPAGTFNLAPSFYGASIGVGGIYHFSKK